MNGNLKIENCKRIKTKHKVSFIDIVKFKLNTNINKYVNFFAFHMLKLMKIPDLFFELSF